MPQPDATLDAIRAACQPQREGDAEETLNRLADAFEDLDRWLSAGGALPHDWRR